LIVVSVLTGALMGAVTDVPLDAPGGASVAAMLGGLALVALGLCCVWFEIGRPWRALNVFFNPRTSWMSREAVVALLLFAAAAGALLAGPALGGVAAALAAAFLFCQSRMLPAARGIPAWRERLVSPLIVLTGLAEGAGLLLLLAPWPRSGVAALPAGLAALLLLRIALWFGYRRRLAGAVAVRAHVALDSAGRVLLLGGTLLPLGLLALASGVALPEPVAPGLPAWGPLLLALAGLAAALGGAWMKFVLITQASFNQGFALLRLPVRGRRAG
jgi:phenylacetyl-CoA:acceptor oxidoreductase subunit 2